MSPIAAFLLGILITILVLFIYWFLASHNDTFKNLYSNSICWNI